MAKYLILETTPAQGMRPETNESISGTFPQGSDIEGTIINQNGFTLISDGIYWQFPVQNLFPIDEQTVTAPIDNVQPKPNFSNNNLSSDGPKKDPIWKHPEMPNYIGAGVGALLGMRMADKLPVLPGPLNWILFTGLGVLGGYKGTQYLIGKIKGTSTSSKKS